MTKGKNKKKARRIMRKLQKSDDRQRSPMDGNCLRRKYGKGLI